MAADITAPGMETCIVTRHIEPMLAFYRDHLGFAPKGVIDVWDTAGMRIHVLAVSDTASVKLSELATPPVGANPGGGMTEATGLRYVTFWVSSVDAVLDGIEASGARVLAVYDTGGAFGASRVAMVEDPEGNVVELAVPAAP
jgi:catechol 2,3-dioxygenase-like lactoylglutathione lyase family enzyme